MTHLHKFWDRWFEHVRKEFCPLLLPFAGQPITYVEIGCWAGASAEWVCRNILTHPGSKGFGIDPYPAEKRHPQSEIDAIKKRAADRVHDAIGNGWQWIYQSSTKALKEWHLFEYGDSITRNEPARTIDVLYIDGDHDAHAVVQDFALAWPHLKAGSLVIFDDYKVGKTKPFPHVKAGYHAILSAWGGLIEEVGTHRWQKAIKVIKKRHGE